MHARRRDHLDVPYPDGESWQQAVTRAGWFPRGLPLRWDGRRVLVIGHVATRRGSEFGWRPGWEYRVDT